MSRIVQRFVNLEITAGGDLIGCADSFELTTDTQMDDVTCKDSNGWLDQEPGEQSWGASATGVMVAYTTPDEGYGYEQMMAHKINKTKVALTWGPDTPGLMTWGGNAYITNVTLGAARGDKQTYNVTFTGAGPLVPALNPTS